MLLQSKPKGVTDMSRRRKDLARHHRAALLVELGNRCAQCEATVDLTFDCKESRGHRHHTMDASARMCFYRQQHREGNLQILCRPCNGRKGWQERQEWEAKVAAMPF